MPDQYEIDRVIEACKDCGAHTLIASLVGIGVPMFEAIRIAELNSRL